MSRRETPNPPFPYEMTPPSQRPQPPFQYGSKENIELGKELMWTNPLKLAEIRDYVVGKAMNSGLPGTINGPEDAYRHTLLAGALVAEFGKEKALAILDAHEAMSGGRNTSNPDLARQTALDDAINVVAIEIMAGVTSRVEAEAIAAQAIKDAILNGGTGANGSIPYLPRDEWKDNRGDPDLRPLPSEWGVERHSSFGSGSKPVRVNSILARPSDGWSEQETRKVMQDQRYWKKRDPAITAAVTRSFEKRYPGTTDGPVQVDAYARGDGTQVAAHTRPSPRGGQA